MSRVPFALSFIAPQAATAAGPASRPVRLFALLLLPAALAAIATGQLTAEQIEALRLQGLQEGWTFVVAENDATSRPLEELCGLVEPADWQRLAVFDPCEPRGDLPSAFDWRALGGCTPIRNQGSCGSCWAFATVGALECNILIKDGRSVDLSEQWLVSCNRSGYSCSGGWFAHEYHQWATDRCNHAGAVLEQFFPYVAWNAPCYCPYPHRYFINRWAYVGGSSGVPPIAAIKQAIMTYGPVSVAVYVNAAFQAYSGGIFNGCASGTVNHAVVLVGWDDAQGVWILRNSWGPNWGEGGYMRIRYNCSSVGYAACYVVYSMEDCNLNGLPDLCDTTCGPAGSFCDRPGCGGSPDCNANTFPDECEVDCNSNGQPDDCDIAQGISRDCNSDGIPDECQPDCNANGQPDDCDIAQGLSSDCNRNRRPDECDLADGTSRDCQPNGIPDECDLMPPSDIPAHDSCDQAELVCPNIVYTGSTVGSTPDGSSTCDPAGSAPDVWYYYEPYGSGILTISLCGSTYDTVLSVHSGCPGTVGNELACNDNYCGVRSHVSLVVFHRQPYWIRVSGAGGAAGDFVLVLSGPACNYSGECNDNGIPDECEPDCNLNRVPDDCDIATGFSADVNLNGIPDECELPVVPGDLNCDGLVNGFDIDPFILALTDPVAYHTAYPNCGLLNGDINGDGALNGFDIDPFVMLLAGR